MLWVRTATVTFYPPYLTPFALSSQLFVMNRTCGRGSVPAVAENGTLLFGCD